MAFSVAKSRPFRFLGLYRSSGKHAAPRVIVQVVPREETAGMARQPAHAASLPRLTGPGANDTKAA
jgi:hypothetical protein